MGNFGYFDNFFKYNNVENYIDQNVGSEYGDVNFMGKFILMIQVWDIDGVSLEFVSIFYKVENEIYDLGEIYYGFDFCFVYEGMVFQWKCYGDVVID